MAKATKKASASATVKRPAVVAASKPVSAEMEDELVGLLEHWEAGSNEGHEEERASEGLDLLGTVFGDFEDGVPARLVKRVTKAVIEAERIAQIVDGS